MCDRWHVLLTMLMGVLLVSNAPAQEAEVVTESDILVEEVEAGDESGEEAEEAEEGEALVEEEVVVVDDGHGHAEVVDVEHVDEHGESAPDPLATDPDLAIWTVVVFLAMLAILSQVAWKPIMEALKAREENIDGAIAAAQQKHEDAKALLADHEAKLAGSAEQIRELMAEAHRDAETTVAQAKADAKAEFEAERQRATRDIEQAKDAAVRSLAERTAGLAIDLAGRVVKQDISADRQSEIVREALGRFSGNGPSAN